MIEVKVVNLSGFKRFQRELPEAVEEGLLEAAKQGREELLRAAPEKTGNLKRSIRRPRLRRGKNPAAVVDLAARYTVFTRGRDGKPNWWGRAWLRSQGRMRKAVFRSIRKALKRAEVRP